MTKLPLFPALAPPAALLATVARAASFCITVGGKTVTPGLNYALPTQLAAVLPANVTVNVGGAPSPPFSFQVVSPSPFLGAAHG